MELKSMIPSGPIEQRWDRHRFEMKLVNPANKRKYSVIVVGSGLAGASASASMAELGYYRRMRGGLPERNQARSDCPDESGLPARLLDWAWRSAATQYLAAYCTDDAIVHWT